MTNRVVFAAASALGIVLASPALAQSAPPAAPVASDQGQDDSQLNDIIVTAQRRAESVQDVPIAVSAFSSDQLRATGVSSALDLGALVPNLIAQNNTGLGSANAYYLRGLGNTETIATFDPPVGTYVDDIYLSRQNANNLNLFDVERVEVLRGPQGTLFGRNTTGGAVNVILRQPGKELGGYAEVGYGSFNKKLARGSIDIPLADTFQIKLSGYWQDDDGYTINNVTHQRLNDDDGWGVRLGMRGELSSRVRWNGSYAYIRANGENILNFLCDPTNPANCNGRFSSTGLSEIPGAANFAGLGVTGRKANYGLGNRTATNLVTSNLAIDLGSDTTLTLITGFVNQSQNYALDFYDGRTGPTVANPKPTATGDTRGGFTIINDGKVDQFSQEVKLNGKIGGVFEYVAGVYYLSEQNSTDFADVFSLSPAVALLLGDRTLRNSTSALAGYAQGDLHIGPALTLTAGIRYTDEIKKIHFYDHRAACQIATPAATCLFDRNFFVPANGTTVPVTAPIPLRQEAKQWTPRFAINYKIDADVLLYASATRGFKSGGWNARGYTPSAVLPFGPEKVWSYEAGIKSEFLNHRLRANIAVYRENVTDLQTPSGIVNPATGAISFVTRNFADYRNTGVEAEFNLIPVRGLNLFANIGYQNDKYIVNYNAPAYDKYGVQSVAAQLAACKAQLAAGQVPGTPSTAPAGSPANNAPACGAGIVTAQGNIATPVRTPDWTLALGGSYEGRLGGGLSLVPSVSAAYHSKQEVATANLTVYTGSITGPNGTFAYNPNGGDYVIGSFSKAAWLVNLGLALNGSDKRWQLSVNCTNCFNEAFVQSALVNTTYYNAPRMWTVRARYDF